MTDASDRRPPINAIRAVIRIQTPPEYDPRIGQVRPGALLGFDSNDAGGPGADLLSVTTSKKLTEPCGRFCLTLTPREVERGSTWADLIPTYSLVEIWLQSYPTNPEPVLVMLGLTDTNVQSEDYGRQEPERQVQINGRELSCIFVDQRTLYLPVPPELLQPEKVSSLPGLPALFTQQAALFGLLAIEPELAQVGASPVDVIDRFVRMVTDGLKTEFNPNGAPLLNLHLPISVDPSTQRPTVTRLRDVLVFDAARAIDALFDQGAVLPPASQLISTGTSLWNLMSTFSDPTYQELFAQTLDLRPTSARHPPPARTRLEAVEIVFRKKPFAGRIDEHGRIVDTRAEVGSQFDAAFERDPAANLHLTDADVMGVNLLRSSQDVRNLYYVYPQTLAINDKDDFRQLFAPLLDGGDVAPASAQRFGLRLLHVADYYFRDPGARVSTDLETAKTRAKLLWYWHRFEPLFWRGQYRTRGNPLARVGTRMVDVSRRGTREFYVTGVTNSMVLGTREPRYVSQLDVERGWPLLA